MPTFFAYCGLEQTAGLWASSFLVIERNVNPETAASYASFFFLGITAGRFLCGFISDKIGVQMASAHLGITLMPPLFGLIADNVSISLHPAFLLLLTAVMLFMTEKLNKSVR